MVEKCFLQISKNIDSGWVSPWKEKYNDLVERFEIKENIIHLVRVFKITTKHWIGYIIT